MSSSATRRPRGTCLCAQYAVELASAECDDAADGIVRRYTDGHPVPGDHLDAEAAHPAAQLGQHFVARIHLHAIQAAAVNGYHRALNINEVILAQIGCPSILTSVTQA